MKNRLYLDNCSFNRPYDDPSVLRNYLEAEAKIYIQKEILRNNLELAWSYVLDYEISYNPFFDRRNQILKWKNIAIIDISESENIIASANDIIKRNIKPKDSLHLACAIEAKCDYFITTDNRILNKSIENIVIVDPINYIRMVEV
jgi:predicted nucleic acid-binding protein